MTVKKTGTKETWKIEICDYPWDTPEKMIENLKTFRKFPGRETGCHSDIAETDERKYTALHTRSGRN